VNGLLLSIRCLLAAVFLVAAVGKFLDLGGSRKALAEFGLPASLARLGGPLLPVAELVVAVALVLRPSARLGGAGALVLLLAFIGGVARAISQNRAPDCHCFGQLHSEPAGPSTLARNAVLAILAAIVIAEGPGPSLAPALTGLRGAQIGLVATAVLTAILALGLAQLWSDKRGLRAEIARLIAAQRAPGLPRGSLAPDFDLIPARGETGSLKSLLDPPRPAVLVFLSTTCVPCLELMPLLAGWQASLSETIALPAIFSGDRDEVARLSEEYGLQIALTQGTGEAFAAYALRATPSAVLIESDGVIAGAPAEGAPAIEALIRNAIASTQRAPQLAIHRG
jgi:thiol-disulfide isomerase/thioredoxin/uncharacterized membrane protein YphA (DoxX/SURF4 family)